METLETKPEEQQTEQCPQETITLMRTCVTCPQNISTDGCATAFSIKYCETKCKEFVGFSLEDPTHPKIMCKSSEKTLELLIGECIRDGKVARGKITNLCLHDCTYFKGFDDLTKQVKCSFPRKRKSYAWKQSNPTLKIRNSTEKINLQLIELQGTQEVVTTGMSPTVMCCKNKNRMGLHIQTSINRCKSCSDFCFIVHSENFLPKLICKGTGTVKGLTLYSSCSHRFNGNIKLSVCLRCSSFKSFDPNTGYVNCGLTKDVVTKTVSTFPKRDLQIQFPFMIPCARRHGEPVTIDECLKNCSTFFKGLYGIPAKVCCTHSKAIDSPYVIRKHVNTLKKPRQKVLQTPCIRWLFEEYTESKYHKKLKINVVCTQIKVNCIESHFETSLEVCKNNCSAYNGIEKDKFHLKCKTESKPLLFVNCPNAHEGAVLLSNCEKCLMFQKIEDGFVVCSQLKKNRNLQINKPPVPKHRNLKISPLTGKPKTWIDLPDEVSTK